MKEYQAVGAAEEEGDGLAGVGHAGDLGDLLALDIHLFHQVGMAQLICSETVDVGDRATTEGLLIRGRFIAYASNEVDLVALDIGDDHNLQFAEEVEGQLVHGIA